MISFSSCKNKYEEEKLYLQPNFTWKETTALSTIDDIQNETEGFLPLTDTSTRNIQNLFKDDGTKGLSGHYVWIKVDFTIPESLKGKLLAICIPYLRMADITYLNGNFIGNMGAFPPKEYSSLYDSRCYTFPHAILKQDEVNTIFIKIWSHGQSAISSKTFISTVDEASKYAKIRSFIYSKIYIIFEGTLFMGFIIFLLVAVALGNKSSYRFFSLINFTTMLYSMPFFQTEIPMFSYLHISYFNFMKFFFCLTLEANFYLISFFIAEFLEFNQPRPIKSLRLLLFLSSLITILTRPDYDALMKVSVPMVIMMGVHLSFGLGFWARCLQIKEKRRPALILLFTYAPALIGVVIDGLSRVFIKNDVLPFFTLFFWQVALLGFILLLASKLLKIYVTSVKTTEELKELNETLDDKVNARTHELQDANYELSLLNQRLERDKYRSDMDLEMASLVQRKFFPQPDKNYKGWQIAICYEPLAKVSGDLYDYYNFNEFLNGISLFDVSGHGISASLITMLSKNIIAHAFQKGFRKKESIEKMLNYINRTIINEKGNIDNYLTGVLCRFDEFDENDECVVEMGNAGHPYPLHYDAKIGEVIEIRHKVEENHYGAIGMRGIDVSFPELTFKMGVGDIFVCYTDGLTESSNTNFEQFGLNRVKTIIKDNARKTPNDILKILTDSLESFTNGQPIEDDITMIILKRTDSSIEVEETSQDNDFDGIDDLEELEEIITPPLT